MDASYEIAAYGAIADTGQEALKYDGGVRAGPPAARNRALTCVISCVSMDLNPSRFALAVRHGDRKRWRNRRCPICGKKASLVFQVIDRG